MQQMTRSTGSSSLPISGPSTLTRSSKTRLGPAPRHVREKVDFTISIALYESDGYRPFREIRESGYCVQLRTVLVSYFGVEDDGTLP